VPRTSTPTWVHFRVLVNPFGPYDVVPVAPWSPQYAANADTFTWANACTWVNPAGIHPGDVAPTAFQSPEMYAIAEFACVRVIEIVSVAPPCAFVRTNPVQPPHADAHAPRIALVACPDGTVTAPDPELPAVACHACAQQFDAAADADPSAANVSPVAVGVDRVLLVSSVMPRTRIRSPEFHEIDPVTSDVEFVSVQVEEACEVRVGAGICHPHAAIQSFGRGRLGTSPEAQRRLIVSEAMRDRDSRRSGVFDPSTWRATVASRQFGSAQKSRDFWASRSLCSGVHRLLGRSTRSVGISRW
jgi:hypothetical protein